jgi:hypothetical protein
VNVDELQQLRPDPLEPEPEQVEGYVEALQRIAPERAELAQREAWEQIRLAGARAGRRRREALDSLNRIFRLGHPPSQALDGMQRGIFVTPATFAFLDPLLRAWAAVWMPWIGKRFDSASQTGSNVLTASAKLAVKVLWPGYELEPTGDGNYVAFRFTTYADPGKLDPDIEALKIDYDFDDNPSFLIRDILDELVEIVPGAHLGKALLRTGEESQPKWNLVGYFALQPPQVARVEEPVVAEAAGAPLPTPA